MRKAPLALLAVVIMLALGIQAFGQPSGAARQTGEAVPVNPLSTNAPVASSSPTPSGEKEKEAILRAVNDIAKANDGSEQRDDDGDGHLL